jgi:transcriptional regulator with XRE-family HTH domain
MNKNNLLLNLAKNVKRLRLAAKMTQEQLAEVSSINTRQICRIENMSHGTSLNVLCKIAEVFQLQPWELYQPLTNEDMSTFNFHLEHAKQIQSIAIQKGIQNIFQHQGGLTLQVVLKMELEKLPEQHDFDVKDNNGNYFHLRCLDKNQSMSFKSFDDLEPHMIPSIQQASWLFAVFEQITLSSIWEVPAEKIQPLFDTWQEQWQHQPNIHLRPPKIGLHFIEEYGNQVYPIVE